MMVLIKLCQSNCNYRIATQLISNCGTFRNYTNRNILSLKERELVADVFPSEDPYPQKLIDLCNSKPQVIYAGFDPTADSLHIGHLAIINFLLHCQRGGHKVIALIGGATGSIGDPSDKTTERAQIDSNVVSTNGQKLKENIKNVFHNHETLIWNKKIGTEKLQPLTIVDNMDWYKSLGTLEFFNKIGRKFRLGEMLQKTFVKTRLDKDIGFNFAEFAYQIFQGYDFFYLHQNYGCNIQVGGQDQLGNIVTGHDLIKRTLKKEVYGVTIPLINSSTGEKFGKTAEKSSVCIWLDQFKTSPFEFYQYFLRLPDADMEKYFKIFTFKTNSEIESILLKHKESPEKRKAQTELARELTLLVHGENGLKRATKATEALYANSIEALTSLDSKDICEIFQSRGQTEMILEAGTTILDMSLQAGCFRNEKDAIAIINAGGFHINHQKITNFEEALVPGLHILPNKITLARVGKKNYYIIKWKNS